MDSKNALWLIGDCTISPAVCGTSIDGLQIEDFEPGHGFVTGSHVLGHSYDLGIMSATK